jgi:hypothetical protein
MQLPKFLDGNIVTENLPTQVRTRVEAWVDNFNTILSIENMGVLKNMGPSAMRGLFLQKGRNRIAQMQSRHQTHFDFEYPSDNQAMRALYEKAKLLQWNGSVDLPWETSVDPYDPNIPLIGHNFVDWRLLKAHGIHFNDKEQNAFMWRVTSWMLSQFLHGEQGALMAAAQVTEATPIFDGKYYGATQVMDEARHVEVFNRYLETKLNLRYNINDNLYTIIDGLMTDSRWDMKFLGMQILVEGLALGAFTTMFKMTSEPLLKELLRRVIQDEARHVHFGLLALRPLYNGGLSEKERIEREDWAFEVVLLMRNRFLAHELYEEGFAHRMNRRQWNQFMNDMPGMNLFRRVMFQRLVPNLRAIGLLTPRILPRYQKIGLGEFVNLPASDKMSDADLIAA